MAKLNQIIGGILSDISQARAVSDVYSRDLKASYKEDPFLKLLSVPRTDIKEVTIDLKFAIVGSDNGSSNVVVIYQNGNYGGKRQELTEGSYNIRDLKIGNDKLSSLKVPQGMKVTLYEAEGFAGREKSFTEDAAWVQDDFNDLTSSIKVERLLMEDIAAMEIEVVANELTRFPEAALSSISLKLDLSNV